MSKVRVSRYGININRPFIKTSKGRFNLLANENENEEKVKQREEKEYYESLPNFNINYVNKKGVSRKFKCDTPEKKKLHPLCIRNNDPNKETKKISRHQKIKNLFNEYHHKVGPHIALKNPITKEYNPGYGEFRNKYVAFINEIRKNRNKEWIYEHYDLPQELKENNIENSYIHEHLLSYTQRQRLRLRGHLSDIIKNIKYKYIENKEKNSQIIQNINSLFNSIDIRNKIKFNFKLDKFIRKFKVVRDFMTKIDRKYLLDEKITAEIINGKKMMHKIFEDFEENYPLTINNFRNYNGSKIYHFLENNKILDSTFIETYYLQFTHRYRKAATYGLIELVNIYKSRIHFLYKLIKIRDLTKENITELIINELILPCIEKYLFYINFGMINNFDNKEAIFETCFEDFYYYHLKLNLHFIVDFFDYNEIRFPNSPTNTGATSNIFNYGNNKIIKKVKDNTFEKIFFEFFKQCCINYILPNYTPRIEEIQFGANIENMENKEIICGIVMEKIEGMTLMHYYKLWIESNIENNDF